MSAKKAISPKGKRRNHYGECESSWVLRMGSWTRTLPAGISYGQSGHLGQRETPAGGIEHIRSCMRNVLTHSLAHIFFAMSETNTYHKITAAPPSVREFHWHVLISGGKFQLHFTSHATPVPRLSSRRRELPGVECKQQSGFQCGKETEGWNIRGRLELARPGQRTSPCRALPVSARGADLLQSVQPRV